MALSIKEENGIFEISGRVTSQNLSALKVYLDLVLEKNNNIVVSLDQVTFMDIGASVFFKKLNNSTGFNNKGNISIVNELPNINQFINLSKTASSLE